MTVYELIGILSAYSPDKTVMVPGYESGFDSVVNARHQRVEPDPIRVGGKRAWQGDFREADPDKGEVVVLIHGRD